MEIKTYFVYEDNEFEKLVIDKLRNGIDGDASKGQEFSVVALEEWNNDSQYAFDNVKKEDAASELFTRWGLKDIEKFIETGEYKPFHPSVSDLLTYMVWKDFIPEGNYLITVCW